jgi:hypothetical protein
LPPGGPQRLLRLLSRLGEHRVERPAAVAAVDLGGQHPVVPVVE